MNMNYINCYCNLVCKIRSLSVHFNQSNNMLSGQCGQVFFHFEITYFAAESGAHPIQLDTADQHDQWTVRHFPQEMVTEGLKEQHNDHGAHCAECRERDSICYHSEPCLQARLLCFCKKRTEAAVKWCAQRSCLKLLNILFSSG